MDLANWALRNSPQGLNISFIRVFDQIRDQEIVITLRPFKILSLLILAALNCRFRVHRCGASGSMRACHAAGPGSIPGRDKFPG